MKYEKIIPKLLIACLFILVFLVNTQIPIMGDDFYYATFIRENFWLMHKTHYLEINGRAIVHFLDSIFLSLPKIFWVILNSTFITGIAYFGSKIVELVTNKKDSFIKSIIIFIFGILILNVYTIRQSVYWITGSFNYVYPLFMFFLYWYVLIKNLKCNFSKKNFFAISFLAFLASATVEQGGMMSFGATVLLYLFCLIDNKKNNASHNLKKIGIILICSFVGIVSVICSPAQFIRFGLEKETKTSFFESAIACVLFLFVTYAKKYFIHLLLAIFAVLMTLINRKKIEKLELLQIYLIISSIILGIGSQIMMIVSPVYGERNTLFGIIMVVFFTAILFSNLPQYNKVILNFLKKAFYTLLIIVSMLNILIIFSNYKITNEIDKENQKIIFEYKNNNSTDPLILYKYKDDNYAWCAPYTSPYHEAWFKVYHKITNSEIIWQEYNKN